MINVGTDPVYGTLYSHDLQGQQFKLMAMILQLNQVRRKLPAKMVKGTLKVPTSTL